MKISDKLTVERQTYQVFNNIPADYYDDINFIRNFIERLIDQAFTYDEIIEGVKAACEKRNLPYLSELITNEIELMRNYNAEHR